MSFDPFKFVYHPPPTVSPATQVDLRSIEDRISQKLSTGQGQSNAGKLIAQLDDMLDTSRYLQQAIVDRFPTTGITIDPEVDPDVAQALVRTYGADPEPTTVTIAMYNQLLDAEYSALQLEMLMPGTSYQTNPVQIADITLINNRIEHHLVDSGEFQYQIPTLLRTLKADSLVYRNWRADFSDYPVVRSALQNIDTAVRMTYFPGPGEQLLQGVASLDVSNPLNRLMEQELYSFSTIYASMYGMLSKVGQVEMGIQNVLNRYVLTPIADLRRVISLFGALKGLWHKGTLDALVDSLGDFALARLAAEVGSLMSYFDRFVHMAVDPVRYNLDSIGGLMQQTAAMGQGAIGDFTSAISGLGSDNACSSAPHNAEKKSSSVKLKTGLEAIPAALKSLGDHLNWATREADRAQASVDEQFRKILARRRKQTGDRLDIMCSLRALDSLVGFATAVINETQRGGSSLAALQPAQQVSSLSRMVTDINAGSSTKFAVQDGSIVLTPAYMPDPPASVSRVLTKGGLSQIRANQLVSVSGVTF